MKSTHKYLDVLIEEFTSLSEEDKKLRDSLSIYQFDQFVRLHNIERFSVDEHTLEIYQDIREQYEYFKEKKLYDSFLDEDSEEYFDLSEDIEDGFFDESIDYDFFICCPICGLMSVIHVNGIHNDFMCKECYSFYNVEIDDDFDWHVGGNLICSRRREL